MTEPSQYFKGRTVQEQMNEVIGYVDTRAAEVATTAIASDVAQVHQDMLDADADATAAAASAAAAAGTLANAVKKTGEVSQSIAGNIEVSGTLKSQGTLYAVGDASVGGNLGVGGSTNVGDLTATGVVAVPTPTGNTHATNKKYVDDKDALDVHLAGNQAITGNKTVPLEATGTFSNQIASSNKVKNELDNYASMVRTGNNQLNITGTKGFTSINAKCSNIDHSSTPALQQNNGPFRIVDMNNNIIAEIRIYNETNGNTELSLAVGETGWDGTSPHLKPRLRIVTRPDGKGSLSFFNGTTSVTVVNYPS